MTSLGSSVNALVELIDPNLLVMLITSWFFCRTRCLVGRSFLPSAASQGPTTDAFDWSSDSNEALDRTLSWTLNAYAEMDAVELQFPAGDTYKFDLELFDGGDDARQVFSVRTKTACDAVKNFRRSLVGQSKVHPFSAKSKRGIG